MSGRAVVDVGALPDGSRFFTKPYSVDEITEAFALMLSGDIRA